MRLQKENLIGEIAVLGVAGIMLAMAFPWCASGVNALETSETSEILEPSMSSDNGEVVEDELMAEEDMMAANEGVATYADVTSSVAISLQQGVDIDVDAAEGEGFSSSTANLVVKMEYTEDYAIFLQTKDGTTALKPRSEHNWAKIVTMPEAATVADFPDNTWGYSLRQAGASGEQLFSSVPGVQTEVARKNVANEGVEVDQWELSFGAKLSTVIPADTYTNEVIVTVVASPFVAKGLDSITYMQEMTPQVCATTAEHVSKSLIDRRDNKSYRVTKLRDGNCWMTENLALTSQNMKSIKGDAILTSEDSDVTNDWTLPTTKTSTGSWTDSNTAAMSMNVNNGHGTYFTWCAATAGTCNKATTNGAVASGSVCPKGWKLPLSGNNANSNNAINGSFYNLLNGYGLSGSASSTTGTYRVTMRGGTKESYTTTSGQYRMTGDPLYFRYGGTITSSGAIGDVGTHGLYASSVSFTDTIVYGLYFYSTGGNPSDYNAKYRYYGRSVRCLAR